MKKTFYTFVSVLSKSFAVDTSNASLEHKNIILKRIFQYALEPLLLVLTKMFKGFVLNRGFGSGCSPHFCAIAKVNTTVLGLFRVLNSVGSNVELLTNDVIRLTALTTYGCGKLTIRQRVLSNGFKESKIQYHGYRVPML